MQNLEDFFHRVGLSFYQIWINCFLSLDDFFYQEQDNWLTWIAVCFGSGIFYGFLWHDISLTILFSCLSVLLALIILLYFHHRQCPLTLYLFIVGFFSILLGCWRTASFLQHLNTPTLTTSIKLARVKGIITDKVFSAGKEKAIIVRLQHLTILECYQNFHRSQSNCYPGKTLTTQELPVKIRLGGLSHLPDNFTMGDHLIAEVSLNPNPQPLLPRTYNFAERAYFQQIGAVGTLKKTLAITSTFASSKYTLQNFLINLRLSIKHKIDKTIPQPEAGVATALLVGFAGAIDPHVAQVMRTTGLAHLIAISGLHMVTVVTLVFFLCNFCFKYYPKFYLHYNSKKLSAMIALPIGFCYLALSGFAISAQRAYVMTSMVLIAIILDRNIISLRSLSIAAMVLLWINPYLIRTPSFQMSFAAVVSLITAFAIFMEYLHTNTHHFQWSDRLKQYLLGILIGSVATEIIINPVAIYHFHLYSPYGDIVNFIAMPTTSFIIIPCGFLSLLLMPFNLQWLLLYPMMWGIKLIIYTAELTLNFGDKVFIIAKFPAYLMTIMTYSIIFLAVFHHKIRFLGIPIFLTALFLGLKYQPPDLIIIPQEKSILLRQDNQLYKYLAPRPISKYANNILANYIGQQEIEPLHTKTNPYTVTNHYQQLYPLATVFNTREFYQLCDNLSLPSKTIIINYSTARYCRSQNLHLINIERNTAPLLINITKNGNLSMVSH